MSDSERPDNKKNDKTKRDSGWLSNSTRNLRETKPTGSEPEKPIPGPSLKDRIRRITGELSANRLKDHSEISTPPKEEETKKEGTKPEEKPQPQTKPAAEPAPKQTKPESTPESNDTPAGKPDTPQEKQETAAEKLVASPTALEVSSEKSVTSSKEPETPVKKPATSPVAQVASSKKPETPVEKPETPQEKQDIAAEKPVTSPAAQETSSEVPDASQKKHNIPTEKLLDPQADKTSQTDQEPMLKTETISDLDIEKIRNSTDAARKKPPATEEPQKDGEEVPWQLILQGVDNPGTTLTINIGKATVIGRIEPGVAVAPDVDMSPYGGAKEGVSRQHAILMPSSAGLWLVDLDSTNGTWINGLYLQPGMKYRLRSGDMIEFGTLKMMVRVVGTAPPSTSSDADSDNATVVSRRKPGRS